jgi:transcriptional regulator with XRE-family HTH domain
MAARGQETTHARVPRDRLRHERLLRGWTLDEVARHLHRLNDLDGAPELGVDAHMVGRWETGKRKVSLRYVGMLSRLYELPPDELGLLDEMPAVDESPAASTDALGLVDSDEMERRAFAAALAMVTGSAVAGRLDVERLIGIFDGAQVDGMALDDLETLTRDLIEREATVAPAALLPAVRGHFEGLRDLLVWTPPRLSARAFSLAGQTALLAGYLMFKQERYAEADAYWLVAERLGDLAGDARLRAGVLVLQGWRWKYDNVPLALELLDRADSVLGSSPDPLAAAIVSCMRGRRRAQVSRTDSSFLSLALRDVEKGQAHLSLSADTDKRFYIFESVPDEVAELHALALKDLKRPQEAAANLEALLSTIDPRCLSWRSYVTASLADVRADMGAADSACELLTDALHLAVQASASGCVREVHATRHQHPQLATYQGQAARVLDDKLQVYTATRIMRP